MRERTARLRFTEDELANESVRKAAWKAEKAADKADQAKSKLRREAPPKMSGKLRHGRADTSEAAAPEKAGPKNQAAARKAQAERAAQGRGQASPQQGKATAPTAPADAESQSVTGQKPLKGHKNQGGRKKTKLKQEPSSAASIRKHLRFDADAAEINPPHRAGRTVAHAAGDAVSGCIHREISQNGDDNVGVQAAHQSGEFAEATAHVASDLRYGQKLRRYDKAVKLEQKADRANVEALRRQQAAGNPDGGSNVFSRWKQKQEIKKQYAAAKAAGGTSHSAASKGAKGAAEKAESAVEKIGAFIREHPKGILIIVIIAALILILGGIFSSASTLLSGITNGVLGTSYTAEDMDITGVEADYAALETALQDEINHIESTHSGYDEYRYYLDEIGHDPYQLASVLTVLLEDYTRDGAQERIQTLFDSQYELELEEVVETRTRGSGDDEEEYDYYILNVTLRNRGLEAVIAELGLTDEQKERYDVLMETKGGRDYLFEDSIYANSTDPAGGYTDYDIPGEALTDERFSNMIREAEKYLGMPYVWGGSSPSTSFDCSGFVSYVINHCGNGWSVGRQTANGLKGLCQVIPKSELEPGDLVFFQGTYSTSGASHVGIYVGGGMMIHCGNPISYASIETPYWVSHWYCGGRLP